MPRHRTIKPEFPHWPGISRVSRDARLLFIYLWTVVDDAGRWEMDREYLLDQYFDGDTDAPMCLAMWLGELAREDCLELYRIDDVEHLRVVNWRRLQTIDRPKPSKLPASPSEPPCRDRRDGRDESPESKETRASKPDRRDEGISAQPAKPPPVTPQRVIETVGRLMAKAESGEIDESPARYAYLLGSHFGLWRGNGARQAAGTPDAGAAAPAAAGSVPLENLFSDEEKGGAS